MEIFSPLRNVMEQDIDLILPLDLTFKDLAIYLSKPTTEFFAPILSLLTEEYSLLGLCSPLIAVPFRSKQDPMQVAYIRPLVVMMTILQGDMGFSTSTMQVQTSPREGIHIRVRLLG
tara:strand:+ start:646 stop:996 length:351 start_codon:yes stop_codon:yes gene_type:complete